MPELSNLQNAVLLAAIGAVAFLYSSVGHGGATGYLAVMALLGIAPDVARPGALWMNCVVASIAFWRFQRAGFFDGKVFWPLAAASIPCAWLGSRMHLEGTAYALVLGGALLAAGWFLGWGRRAAADAPPTRPIAWPLAVLAGGGLGLLAGLTGIGGGVFLTPLLIFLNWTPAKVAGGISALVHRGEFRRRAGRSRRQGAGLATCLCRRGRGGRGGGAARHALGGEPLAHRRLPPRARRVLWIAAGKLMLTGK